MVTVSRDEALRRRYGSNIPNLQNIWNDVLGHLISHRSIRSYKPDKLPAGAIDAILTAAQSASSSSNLQTWSVVVVEDAARKERLSVLAGDQKHIRQAPVFLVWLSDLSRISRLAERHGKPDEALHFLETFLLSAIDSAIAAQTAFVALESLGLGGVYAGAIRNNPIGVARELQLPPLVAPVVGLSIGYPDETPLPSEVKPRLLQSTVVHHETYSAAAEETDIGIYDGILRSFQKSQQLPQVGWVETVLKRVGSSQALNGRDRLREELSALGYKLR